MNSPLLPPPNHRSVLAGLLAAALYLPSFCHGQDWPEFRGPTHDGHAANSAIGLPSHWTETENVKWKTPIPHRGWSTPVTMNGKIWLTTATEDGHEFFGICLDAETGKILFNGKLFQCDAPEPLGNNLNCYAAPSPVIEQGRVYLHFGSYGTACLDTDTYKVLWKRNDLPCSHWRGPGSSPILFEDLLILTMDGADVQYLVALNKKDGQTVWKTDRTTVWDDLNEDGQPKMHGDFRKGFSTPLVVNVDGKLSLVSPGSKAAFAYDPRTGKEIWKLWHGSHTAAPSPLFTQGLVLFVNGIGKPELLAIKPQSQGELTDADVVWKANKAVPKTASPIAVDDLLYSVTDEGAVTCLEIANGNQLWKESLGGRFAASPIYADGKLYFANQQGSVKVLKPGRTYELMATNTLEEGCLASPAVAGNALLLRTKSALYRIEQITKK